MMIRVPGYDVSGSTPQLVEAVDIYPTLADLAGAPPLDPTKKQEPALGGTSLKPLILETLSSGGRFVGNQSAVALSQYARHRCRNNLFFSSGDKNITTQQNYCKANETGNFIGYSIRRDNNFNGTPNDGVRYTRWVNVTQAGEPFWQQVIGEELYVEHAKDGDDFDKSESYGNLANDPSLAHVKQELNELLQHGMAP